MVADFNLDGKPDLSLVTSNGSVRDPFSLVSVFLGQGDGTFGTRADYETGLLAVSPAAGDFNLDGKLDLAGNGRR